VKTVEAAVHLKKTAHELGLTRGEDKVRRFVAWIPGAK
jgi:hypothetical protein